MWSEQEKEAGRDLLGYYGYRGGHVPGGFTTKLISLMESADSVNKFKLFTAFPQWTSPVMTMQNEGAEAVLAKIEESK